MDARRGGPAGSIDWKRVFEKLKSLRAESTIRGRWNNVLKQRDADAVTLDDMRANAAARADQPPPPPPPPPDEDPARAAIREAYAREQAAARPHPRSRGRAATPPPGATAADAPARDPEAPSDNVPDQMKAAADGFRHEPRRDDTDDDEDIACPAPALAPRDDAPRRAPPTAAPSEAPAPPPTAELEKAAAAAKIKGKKWKREEDEALRRAVGESRMGGPVSNGRLTGYVNWKSVFEKLKSLRSESAIMSRWAELRQRDDAADAVTLDDLRAKAAADDTDDAEDIACPAPAPAPPPTMGELKRIFGATAAPARDDAPPPEADAPAAPPVADAQPPKRRKKQQTIGPGSPAAPPPPVPEPPVAAPADDESDADDECP